jgi:hypothetical protein
MHKPDLAGATALVAAPVLAIAGIAVSPTMPDQPADQVTAGSVHHFASGLCLRPPGFRRRGAGHGLPRRPAVVEVR